MPMSAHHDPEADPAARAADLAARTDSKRGSDSAASAPATNSPPRIHSASR